jgi:hypothetical protein
MRSIITTTILLISTVMLTLYLLTNSYFSPYVEGGDIAWYNVTFAGILIMLMTFSFSYLVVYVGKKLIAYNKGEFPTVLPSVFVAGSITFTFMLALTLHIFHILTFGWGGAIGILLYTFIRMIIRN